MITSITYRKAILVSTGQYENQRVEYEATAAVSAEMSVDEARAQLKRTVDSWILDAIVEIKYGKTRHAQVAEEERFNSLRKTVAKTTGLGYLIEGTQ